MRLNFTPLAGLGGGALAQTVAEAAPTDAVQAAQPIARAAYRPGAAPQVIARNDMVRVTYQVGGVNLSVMGKALRQVEALPDLESARLIPLTPLDADID